MSEVEEVTQTIDEPVQTQTTSRTHTTTSTPEEADNLHGKQLAVRVIWFINGVLMTLLGLRFVLALLGANPNSGFGNFIYSITQPFVAPFFGVFSYDSSGYVNGQMYFEGYTLLAMLIYALIAWGLAKLIMINRRNTTVPA